MIIDVNNVMDKKRKQDFDVFQLKNGSALGDSFQENLCDALNISDEPLIANENEKVSYMGNIVSKIVEA